MFFIIRSTHYCNFCDFCWMVFNVGNNVSLVLDSVLICTCNCWSKEVRAFNKKIKSFLEENFKSFLKMQHAKLYRRTRNNDLSQNLIFLCSVREWVLFSLIKIRGYVFLISTISTQESCIVWKYAELGRL